MKNLFLLLIFVANYSFAQQKDAEQIIKKAKDKITQVKDYEADIEIKLDVEFIKMPTKKAKVYFKQPNKLKFEAQGFIVMHKKGMNFSLDNFLTGNYTAIYVKSEKIDNIDNDVIKIIPSDENSDLILSTLWIDAQKSVVRKVESHSKTVGSISMELFFNNLLFDLPTKMIVKFDSGNKPVNMPFNQPEEKEQKKDKNKKKPTKGSVIITYSNYKINKGISDEKFK